MGRTAWPNDASVAAERAIHASASTAIPQIVSYETKSAARSAAD
jgi:hypothetical protein